MGRSCRQFYHKHTNYKQPTHSTVNATELSQRMSNGEDSFTQFKRQAIPAKELAKEFVAFLNAEGGIIVYGSSVKDLDLSLFNRFL